MMLTRHAKPDFFFEFENHCLFKSTRLDETIKGCTRALGPHHLRIRGTTKELSSSFHGLVCEHFAIVRLSHALSLTVEPQLPDDYIVHHRLSGGGFLQRGEGRIEMNPGDVTVTSPGEETRVGISANSLNVVVRLPRKKVKECIQNLLQRTVKQPVVFETRMQPSRPVAALWINAVQHICNQHEFLHRTRGIGAGVEGAFSEYLINLLLQIQPHNYSSYLGQENGWFVPHYVRKARDFIHGNISEHISIATLATLTGVSARTLQTGFKRALGQTPMEYVREQRIQYAHRELLSGDPDTRVTEVFAKFGIYDFGRYARFYKNRYGILPSERLKGRRLG